MTDETKIELPQFERETTNAGSMEWMILKGPHGAVQFVWMGAMTQGIGVDLGWHRPCDEDDPDGGWCTIYGTCIYDGSGTAAEHPYKLMVAHGPMQSGAIWKTST